MIGKPKFKKDEMVKFKLSDNKKNYVFEGKILIVDAYGTFEQNEEVSYDILVEGKFVCETPCLVKHVRESDVLESVKLA